MHRYFIINKPYGVLSQFSREVPSHRVLGDLFDFPPDVYPVGRLDRDSEGLLILTNDKRVNQTLLHPRHAHLRTYWARVEGHAQADDLAQLAQGVTIKLKGKMHRCAPLKVRVLKDTESGQIPPRNPPVRFRKTVPDQWLELQLTEGKNRQVRRMCAKVGLPVLRLIRVRLESLTLKDLAQEQVQEVDQAWLFSRLKL
ncbi:MAG: pseudouridine synthase [Bacteroidota bacterium]